MKLLDGPDNLAQGPAVDDVVSTRVFAAPRGVVFRAFADPALLARWWGPRGFANAFLEFDLRPGGMWRFRMRGPDGATYDMEKRFVDVVPEQRVVLRHLGPMHEFVMAMEYADWNGGTRLTWRMRFESAGEAEKVRPFIAAANEENFDRLEALLAPGA